MSNYGSIPLKQQLSKAERDLLQSDRPGYGSHTKVAVALNLVNATVGAGIIGLPFAIARAGFFTGILASIVVAALAQIGLFMLILAGQRVGIYKFALLVEYLLGRPGYHFLNFMICVQAGVVLLPMLCERYLPQWPLLANRTFILVFVGIVCILPLNMSRSIGSLARWSIVSVLCLPVILLTILIRAPAYAPKEGISLEWVGQDVFGALGIMAFAFTCHQVAFNNFLTLKDQTTTGWKHTTLLSTGLSWLISMTFAVIGYMCFGSHVQPNLFMNFASDDPIVNLGRLALSVSMILTIPMGIFPTREAIQKSLGFETATQQPTDTQHYAVTFVLFGALLGCAVAVRSLGTVYSLVGGFSATTLAYILPAAAYLVTRSTYLKNISAQANMPKNFIGVFPTLTGSTILTPDESDLKTPILWETASCSSSRQILIDDDVSTVNSDLLENDVIDISLRPRWWLDIAAVLLILWGFVVMFFSISATLQG
ncbi:transmembrane amino acid transporter protein-domain-containing protein [Gilbertella persicaria]|uniref:transmembrane amino acid transporter protein-domain-containing protein n=1 Tax=Gilbertella persicaria TaxID=101096 RepID=UPI00221F7070|nr:transmembrane amino acid transporter protein-domain-containing protein [Gilbertella persicaria]KAI8075410.1 transmembrane amino acid transporter protein-domain-containing protein [Gilbertella persicaria]